MRRIILFIAVFALAAVATMAAAGAEDEADGPKAGDERVAIAFCMTRSAAETLAEQVKQNGKRGYAAVMADQDTPCYDSRIHDGEPLRIKLVERGWTTESLEGMILEFWRVTDPGGYPGWIWIKVSGRRS